MLEADSSRPFLGVRFLLAGFDPAAETKVRSKLLEGGGVDAGGHDQGYTHLIVDKIAYDDPVCVKAREDGKTLVTGLWVDHSFEVDAPVDATSIIYRPLKDMNGIPGAKNLVMCLTGYQRQDRDDIMTMVGLMGAQFSKPLVANKVTHLICYKFEGEKYELANKLKRIKLVNHRWLEDCLSYWKLLPEENYSKSGYELEMMEAEAKDSDEEADDTKTKQSIPHAMESLQNSKDGTKASGSSEMGGQAVGIGRLSASGVSRPLNSASVQLPNPQERTPESIRIANDPKSVLRSAEKASSQPDIKFSASINGKTPRRSPKSIFSRESSRADSSSKLHLGDPMHVPNIDNIEHVKDLFASGYDKAPQKEATELLTAETSIDKTQWMEASRPTTLLEKPQLTATPSASEFDSKSVVNNLLRSDKKPRLSGGFVRDILGKEKAEEINKNSLLEIGGLGELQEHNKGESTTSPCSMKSGQKVPSTSANTDKDGKEAKTVQQPLRKKTIGKKTLGSKPKLNGTVNQKGSIYLNKTGGDDAPTISPDVECEGTGFGWVSGAGELDKSRETIAIAPEGVQNRAASGVARACFADDETEEPEDKEECATVLIEKNFKLSRSSGKMKQISREPQLGAESTSGGNTYEPEAGKDHRQPSGETVLNAEEIPQDIKGKAVGKKRGRPSNAGKTKNKTSSQKKSRDFKQVEKENHPLVDGDENQSPTRENLGKRAVASNETLEGISLKVKKSGESPTPVIDIPNQVKSQPAYFIMSGHRLQRKEFQQLIKRLRGKCCRDSHQWSYQATHYISPEPIRRTEKFFAAAASGRWILKTDYLTACNQAGKFIPEEPFEWHENGLSEDGAINLEAPRKWRLLRAQTGHGAFYGMRIVIYGECIAPPLDTLKRVLKAGDGTVLATSPPYTRFLTSGVDYAVISPGMPRVDMWVQEFLKHEIPCVAADYLVDYVCKPGCSLEKHVLYGSHASAEKSLANLLKRAEEVINY